MFKALAFAVTAFYAQAFLNPGAALSGTLNEKKDGPKERFLRLDHSGRPHTAGMQAGAWPCVLDTLTGLMWEVKTAAPGLHFRDNVFPWTQPDVDREPGCGALPCDAHAFVRAVNAAGLCGARDWRLPRREELRSLVDYTVPYPGPTLDQRFFPHARSQFYWAVEANAAEAEEAWGMGFAFGFDYAYYTTDRAWVRLVRGSELPVTPTPERFAVVEGGGILDRQTQLIWAQCAVGQQWNKSTCEGEGVALRMAEARALARVGWRIPSLQELSSLVDLATANPAIDGHYFPGTPAGDFWTATPFVNQPGSSWRVNFREGEAHGVKDKVASYLRLVRNAK